MIKYILILFFTNQLIFAQNDSVAIRQKRHNDYINQLGIDDKTKVRNYMKLSDYRKIYKNKGIKISLDTIGFIIPRKDTLVVLNSAPEKDQIYVSRPFELRDSTFISLYKKVAFNEGSRGKTDKQKKLMYWKSDVKLFFAANIEKNARINLLNFAKTISKGIDSLQIYEVKEIQNANYIIYGENDYNYCDGLLNSKSDYYISWDGKNIINKGFVKISKELYFNEKVYNQKLNEFFLQSLGYFMLTNEIGCSNYFSNCFSENKKVSPIDIELLKYHYSYGICKGISEASFDDFHRAANETRRNSKGINSHSVTHIIERRKK